MTNAGDGAGIGAGPGLGPDEITVAESRPIKLMVALISRMESFTPFI